MKYACYPMFLLVTVTCLLTGCGPHRPETVEVTGQVTIDGVPASSGRINFYPEEGRSSTGVIQPDGTFTMTTFEEGDGCLPGEHVVTIKATETTNGGPASFEQELQGGGMPGGETKWLVHPKFADRQSTPLRATVDSDAETFTFDLTKP